ncbi:MAG TPA: diguanylate cyclase [Thermoanaerobaculaceae bacterium]|nr:diguanylate cyclase [Thermoanaerobaculaceae bacterium]
MAPELDLKTLAVAATLVDAALCAALVLFWRTQKTYAGFGHWVASQSVALFVYLLVVVRGPTPARLPTIALSGLMVAGAALRSRAILLFFDRVRGVLADVVAGAAVLAAVFWLAYVADSPGGRALATGVCVAFVMCRAAAGLAPSVRTHGLPAALAIAFLVTWPAVLLALVAKWMMSSPGRALFVLSGEMKTFFLFLIVHDVAITIFFLMLNARRLAAELVATQSALERLAVTDALTGLPNRRRLDERLAMEWQRRRRSHAPLSLLVIDIDHFKAYNDRHGHLEGDDCLVRLAGAMHAVLREGVDLLCRLGGEEFVAVLPGSGPEEAGAVAERVRRQVEAFAVPHGASETSPVVTVSVGWASTGSGEQCEGPDALLALADAALYRAKREGRNRVAPHVPSPAFSF